VKIAGVRLEGGRTVWTDASDLDLAPRAHVVVRLDGSDEDGIVLVAPHQLIQAPETVQGTVTVVHPDGGAGDSCADIPGGQMPPLGTTLRTANGHALVIGLDPVAKTINVQCEGEQHTISLDEILTPDSSGMDRRQR
jgi:hypothetical protein